MEKVRKSTMSKYFALKQYYNHYCSGKMFIIFFSLWLLSVYKLILGIGDGDGPHGKTHRAAQCVPCGGWGALSMGVARNNTESRTTDH